MNTQTDKQRLVKVKRKLIELETKNQEDNHQLLSLLKETHERMYSMMEWVERLQPIKLEETYTQVDNDINHKKWVDITDEEEGKITNLFRLQDPEFDHNIHDDQTSRSILKDLRKVIKSLEL